MDQKARQHKFLAPAQRSFHSAIDFRILSGGNQPSAFLASDHKYEHAAPRIRRSRIPKQFPSHASNRYVLSQESCLDITELHGAALEYSVVRVRLIKTRRVARNRAVRPGMLHLNLFPSFPPTPSYIHEIGVRRKKFPECLHIVAVPIRRETLHKTFHVLRAIRCRRKSCCRDETHRKNHCKRTEDFAQAVAPRLLTSAFHPSTTLRISASGTAPSRIIDQSSPCSATIVDESVAPVSPPSKISGKRSPNCFTSCCALLHAGKPDKFALVPVTGPPKHSIKSPITRDFGQRSATRPLFPVTFNGKRCVASTTIVSAPGQNFCAKSKKLSGKSRDKITACSTQFTRIGSAFVSARPFTSNTRPIAARL